MHALQHRGNSSKSARNIQEGPKLMNFRVRTGKIEIRVTLSGDEITGRSHCSFMKLSSPQAGPVQAGMKSVLSINLANTIHPAPVIS